MHKFHITKKYGKKTEKTTLLTLQPWGKTADRLAARQKYRLLLESQGGRLLVFNDGTGARP